MWGQVEDRTMRASITELVEQAAAGCRVQLITRARNPVCCGRQGHIVMWRHDTTVRAVTVTGVWQCPDCHRVLHQEDITVTA